MHMPLALSRSRACSKLMSEEHRFKYGKRAWEQEQKFIHRREEFRAEDKFEVQSREADEKAATDALVFGFTGMASFLCVPFILCTTSVISMACMP